MRPIRTPALLVVAMFLLVPILGSCSSTVKYLGFWKQQRMLKKGFEEQPSAEALRRLQPQHAYLLLGEVTLSREHRGPVLVVAVTDKFQKREIGVQRIMQVPVRFYQVVLAEGNYDLYFFVDLDENGFFDASEMVGQTAGKPISIDSAAVSDGLTFKGPAFFLDLDNPRQSDLPIRVAVKERSYIFDSLDDEFFDSEYGDMGLYNPKDFISHTQRSFFALEKLDTAKTIVLFVHGIGGTPRDFKYLVDGLDRKRFQPWFYYYPSGLPLQKLGAYLADAISLTNESRSFDHSKLIVVAHSMGGLVALSGLNELCVSGKPPYLKGYISFDSPYGGVEAAKMAEKYAPALVPCWRDLATGSEFLENLYRGKASANIPFYLFFGYKTGDSSDGAITLQSQLEQRVQFNALKSYGFNATHVGILNDEKVRQAFLRMLDNLDQR